MKSLRYQVIRAGMDALYFSGAHALLRPVLAGLGTIFTLHHVRPPSTAEFQPNQHLEITPDFLHATLAHLRAIDVEIISLDEMYRRIVARDFARRFACFTFDDGYRDNRDFALPVMREFNAPFTVFVASDFAAGTGRLWWLTLERIIAGTNSLELAIDGVQTRFDTSTADLKQTAYDALHDWLQHLPGPFDVRSQISSLSRRYGVDETAICPELCMTWDELKAFAADPLVTIGAHTISHCNLAKQPEANVIHEMSESRARIQNALQRPVDHFAYPYGSAIAARSREFAFARSLGFKTAVTTRPGMLFAQNVEQLTALPRLSLNGHYQDRRMLPVLTSGAATAIWNGFRRISA